MYRTSFGRALSTWLLECGQELGEGVSQAALTMIASNSHPALACIAEGLHTFLKYQT